MAIVKYVSNLKKKSSVKKKKNIEKCSSKTELKKFTRIELIAWIENNYPKGKKVVKKLKEELIDIIWAFLKKNKFQF